ncbi:MAG: DUF362 domain-containing protein [Magnetococcales bacterium]|nr:DUF362 domain-containing protein [Magnetococcales bacterium]
MLRELALAGGLAVGTGAGGWLVFSREPVRHDPVVARTLKDFRVAADPHYPVLAVVRGQRVEAMVREAVEKLGGMSRFIAKGDTVLLKPNIGWDRQPQQAANTNPEVVAALVRLCREAGAKRVQVSDFSLNDPPRCFQRSGIEQAAREAGGQVILPGQNDFVLTRMDGQMLKEWPVVRFLHEADKVINIPVAKHHSLSGCTLAMKNWYGMIGGRRNQLHQDIHTSIADLASAMRPTLTVMDATRVLKRNGPTGGNPDDVSEENTLVAGLDEVAIDSWSLRFFDLQPTQVPYLALGHARGLGTPDWRSLNVVESQIG